MRFLNISTIAEFQSEILGLSSFTADDASALVKAPIIQNSDHLPEVLKLLSGIKDSFNNVLIPFYITNRAY